MSQTLFERLAFLAFGLVLLLYLHSLSTNIGKSSDQANLLLAGIDMLHGNWRLHGWSMVADNYWTSDVAMGGALSGIRWLLGRPEVSPSTLVWQPAISWTIVTLASVFLAQRGLTSTSRRWSACLMVLASMGVPVMRAGAATALMLLSGIHILTILYALLAMALGQVALVRQSWPVPLASMVICVVLAVASDPLSLFICVAPMLIVAALSDGWRMVMIGTATALAALLGHLLVAANAGTGGFAVAGLPLEFAKFDDLGRNAGAVLHGLMAVFSADFTGRQVGSALPDLLHVPLMIFAAIAVGLKIAQLAHGSNTKFLRDCDFLTASLAVGAALDIAALWLSRRVEYENGSFATARYLFPAWVFGSILLARHFGRVGVVRLFAAAALSGSLLYNHNHTPKTAAPALNGNEYALLAALQAQPVRVGFAGYWQAALMQVASGNRLRVEACIADDSGHIVPLRNANKVFSLGDITGQDFFVVLLNHPLYFDRPAVIRSFGQPDHTQVVSDFTVMFYHGRATG